MSPRTRWTALALLVSGVLLAAAACGGGDGDTETALPPTQTPAAPDLQIAFASSDLSVGENRVAFGLIDRPAGTITDAGVQVSTFYLAGGAQEGPVETVSAVFRRWPIGQRGVYTARLSFDRSGTWGLGIVATMADGSSRTASTRIEVKETSATPAIGAPAPRSASKTARDVTSLAELTSDPEPDPDLYSMTIAEAAEMSRPMVVTFATPAYCTSATCGPQVDVIKELKRSYGDRASFVHVEIYDNPQELQGNLSRGRISPTVTQWNLPSEPWTFVVDAGGLVAAKFEGFTTQGELEEALAELLR